VWFPWAIHVEPASFMFQSTQGSFLSLGVVDRSTYVKTRDEYDFYAKQVIDELATTDVEVAKLRNEALALYRRTPADYSMEKPLCVYAVSSPCGQIVRGHNFLREYLFERVGPCKYLTEQEAIDLIEERQSSPGWPFTERWDTRGKFLQAGVHPYIDSWWDSGHQSVWTGCLKDEVMKKSKIENGLVRFFFCCPLPVQIRLLQFGGVLNKRIVELSRQFAFPTYLGVSSYDRGWHNLFSPFRGKKHFFSLDETNYDSTISAFLMAALYDIRNSLLDVPCSDVHLSRLLREVVQTVIVTDTGHLVQKRQGNPSGSPNTSVDNSLILIMLYFEAYFRVYPSDTLVDFFANVSLVVIGDDNFCGVSDTRSLFDEFSVMNVMHEWGIVPKVECVSDTLEGMEFVSKLIKVVQTVAGPILVPVPKPVRFTAHLLMSTPGYDALLSAVKVNSLLAECAFDDVLWRMCIAVQQFYRRNLHLLQNWEDDQLTMKTWYATLLSRAYSKERFLYGQKECGFRSKSQPHKIEIMKRANKQKKKVTARGGVPGVQPKAKRVAAAARGPSSSSALGSLVSKAANFAEKIPIIGNAVEKVDSVASSILGFLGLGSSMFTVHYDLQGRQRVIPHRHVVQATDEKGLTLTTGELIEPGSIVMKYAISIGPQGSRSRAMGQLYEKVRYHGFQLTVNANCAASSSGSLAYLYVPDPSDTTLDSMANSERLSAVCSRENVQFAQVWQSTILNFRIPPKEYYVKLADSVERLTSPGTVYVITMTSVDTSLLPTLRQTSSFTFLKPTNAPAAEQTELVLMDGSSQIVNEGAGVNWWVGHTKVSLGNFDNNRLVSTNYNTILDEVNHHLGATLLVYKGERVVVAIPTRTTSSAILTPRLHEPVWMPRAVVDKPGHPKLWSGAFESVTVPLPAGGFATAGSAFYAAYEYTASEDIEVCFLGPSTADGATELCDGYVMVFIDKTGVTTAFDVEDAFRVQRAQGKITLFKKHPMRAVRRSTMNVQEETPPVMVPRTPQPITTVRSAR